MVAELIQEKEGTWNGEQFQHSNEECISDGAVGSVHVVFSVPALQ